MREITKHENNLIAIMRKYGDVYIYEDNIEECAILGNIHINGFAWTHIGKGNRLDISPIEGTYAELKSVMLSMVNTTDNYVR